MAENERLFISRLAFSLATGFEKFASRAAKSKTISNTLELHVLNFDRVAVESPFYWAQYYHDGRSAFRARKGHKIVYFKDLDKDPRIRGRNYPKRAADIVKLTKKQFYRYLRDPGSGMVVADSVGKTKGDPFFKKAGRLYKKRATDTAGPKFSEFVRACMGDLMDAKLTRKVILRF